MLRTNMDVSSMTGISPLARKLQEAGIEVSTHVKATPLWRGPEKDGITFSLLCRFLCCRERFRILVIEGLKPVDYFNHKVEYGNMWHVCEERFAKYGGDMNWREGVSFYAKSLCRKYSLQQEQIDHWYNVCKIQFSSYISYWANHPDIINYAPLIQEQVFDVPYKLDDGRIVRLRGKWDSVDLVGRGKDAGIYLQENKTKADINETKMVRQLTFDLQTMIYLIALQRDYDSLTSNLKIPDDPYWNDLLGTHSSRMPKIHGVRYNVVRRPLSGGKGSIVRHKATKNQLEETKEHYYNRLSVIIRESPEDYFMRWKIEVSSDDIEKFRKTCLDPILAQLCDWWQCISGGEVSPHSSRYQNYRHPFGVYNVLDEGGSSDLDEYLATGSEIGLRRVDNLFSELS